MVSSTVLAIQRFALVSSVFLSFWSDKHLLVKAQGQAANLPGCVSTCATSASKAVGCSGFDALCACPEPSFLPLAQSCMSRSCSQDDENTGIAFLYGVCNAVGGSSSDVRSSSEPVSSVSSASSGPSSSQASSSPTNSPSPSSSGGSSTPSSPPSSSPSGTPTPTPSPSATPTSPIQTGNTLPAAVSLSEVVTPAAASSSLPTLNPQTRSTSTVTIAEPLPPASPTGSLNGAVRLGWSRNIGGVGFVMAVVVTTVFGVLEFV